MASKCARIWCVRPVSRRTRSSDVSGSACSSDEVRARRPRLVRVDRHPRARRGGAPSGASIVPLRDGGRPSTSATYSRTIWRAAIAAFKPAMSLLALGDHEQSRGVLVEPVHDTRTPRPRPQRPRGARAPARACRRGADRPGERRFRRPWKRRSAARPRRRSPVGGSPLPAASRTVTRRGDRDRLTAAQPIVLACGHPVERHGAGHDPPLRLRSRAEPRGEELIEPLAGGLRRDAQRFHDDPRATAASAHRS